nr:HAMP domain-containing histidine kinase [Acetatifactor sp.]
MKFRTRLTVTFITIIVLPFLLTIMAFLMIGFYLTSARLDGALPEMDPSYVSESMKDFVNVTDQVYDKLQKQVWENPAMLEDKEYLQRMNDEISRRSTYLIVRKNNELYYAGNERAAEKIFEKLPEYRDAAPADDPGYYYKDQEGYVRQLDFTFTDGSHGSIFVVTTMNVWISKKLLIDMLVAIFLILVFTSCMLTQWIHKGVFTPITQLNIAMQKIKDGNFEYALITDAKGEMGDLYRNYEDMRLRLKESAEEKVEQEKVNRELVSNISHDLKTPITAIKGYVEGIMDGVADTPEKMDKYIKTIYNKANDMDKLINELTMYSGLDNNRIPYNFHRINVADYFGDCVEEVGLDLESR